MDGAVLCAVAQPDGKVIIGGQFSSVRGAVRNHFARLNTNGTVDGTFAAGTGADGDVHCVAVQPDGSIIVGGYFQTINGAARNGIARLKSDGTLDNGFNPGLGPEYYSSPGSLAAIALQPDGRILIGGYFTTFDGLNRNGITRLNADGTLDITFNPGRGIEYLDSAGAVFSIAVQSNGKILLAGSFTTVNGTNRNSVARLNSNGSLDLNFDPGSGAQNGGAGGSDSDSIYSIAVQSTGRIILAGDFISINGTNRNYVARLNTNGALDLSFNTASGPNATVYSIAIQSDDKVVMGGGFSSVNGTTRNNAARLTSAGALDSSFNSGAGTGGEGVYTVAVQTNGWVWVGGNFRSINGTQRDRIARFTSAGSLDGAFNPGTGPSSPVYSTAIQTDGKVVIGGAFTIINGTNRSCLARLQATGGLDTTFNPGTGANDTIESLVLQTDGKVLVGGYFTTINGTVRNCVARLSTAGALDATFNPGSGANDGVLALALQSDGKVIAGGAFTAINGTGRNRIARFNTNGSLDASFNPGSGADADIDAVAVQPDGKILIGGSFTAVNGTNRSRIARLNSSGGLDTTFNSGAGADGDILAIALQPDGRVVLGGQFTSINGINRNYIARLTADGSLDTAFDPGVVNGIGDSSGWGVMAVALQADGKVIVAGEFTGIDGRSRNRLARLNADGRLDRTFDPGLGAGKQVYSIALQADGKMIVAGAFGGLDVLARAYTGRLQGGTALLSSIPLNLQKIGDHVVFTWTNDAFDLQVGSSVNGVFTNVPGARSPHTNSAAGP
ncbi:MAG: hypothetical protein QOF48_288, partial [Verrucomicrobiota bacterium]